MTKEKSENSHNNYKAEIGLALGGGIARGFSHIGVIKALLEHDIRPTIVAGTSIGAVVGGCYLANRLDDLEEWALSLNRKKIFSYLDFRVRSAGMIGGKRLTKTLEQYFEGMAIEDLGYPFVAIATDLVTGHEVWLRKGDFIEALRASFALPGVFPPVNIDQRLLIDGALVNPVPVSPCRALGARLTIAVDLNSDLMGKVAKPGQKYQTITGFDIFGDPHTPQNNKKLFSGNMAERVFSREPDKPSLFGVMVSALNITQDRLTRSRLAGDPPDIHIKPKIGHIGLMEFERAEELIEEGYRAAESKIAAIMAASDVLLPNG